MKMNKILVGTSSGVESDLAVGTALRLAHGGGRMLHLVHAYTSLPATAMLGTPGFDAVLEEDLAKIAMESVTKQLERLGIPRDCIPTLTVRPGPPHQVIAEVAEATGADLIVVGASERGGVLLGSTADRVLRRSRVPVLVVREGLELPPRQVLVGVDLSPISAAALRLGASFGARTEAVFVLEPGVDRLSCLTPDQLRGVCHGALAEFVTRHSGRHADRVRPVVRYGPVRDEILAEMELVAPDLMVFGTHGPKALERLLIGSVAERLAHRAGCSMLLVPPEAALRLLEEPDRGADWEWVSDERRPRPEVARKTS